MKIHKSVIHIGAGLIIAAVALYLTYSRVDMNELSAILSQTNWFILLLVPIPLALSYLARIKRWEILLSPSDTKVTFKQATGPLLVGFMVNSLLPARVGEVARALLLSRKTGIPRATSIATVVLARLFDGLVITLMAILAMISLWGKMDQGIRAGMMMVGIFYIMILFLVVMLRIKSEKTINIIMFPFKLFGKHVREKVERVLHSFAVGLAVLQSGKELIQVICWSVAVWGLIVFTVIPVFYAMALPMLWYFPVLVIILAAIGMQVPTPAGTGTVHAALAFALPPLTGVSSSNAQVLAVIFHVTQFLPIITAGLVAGIMEGVTAREIDRIEEGETPGEEQKQESVVRSQ